MNSKIFIKIIRLRLRQIFAISKKKFWFSGMGNPEASPIIEKSLENLWTRLRILLLCLLPSGFDELPI
jgi:hypothetical protein